MPFKLLVAVKSSRQEYRLGLHDVIRRTWGQQFRGLADVRFFVGKNDDPRDHVNLCSDEVMLSCADDVMALPWKVHDICQWVVGKVYTHILLVNNGTQLDAGKVLASGFEHYDYQGVFNRPLDDGPFDYNNVDPRGIPHYYQQCYPWAIGEYGYFLSRSTFMMIADRYPNQNEWMEDLWVGQLIGRGAAVGEFTINSREPT